jgi:hypothetical protein
MIRATIRGFYVRAVLSQFCHDCHIFKEARRAREYDAAEVDMRKRLLAPAALVALFCLLRSSGPVAATQSSAPAAPALTCASMEEFLRTAKIGRKRESLVGVTAPSRAALDDGTRQHDASIQGVDVSEGVVQTDRGAEQNFRDTWKFNVAGYELAKLLELNMIPPYVERKVSGQSVSLSWWIDGAMMERDRTAKKLVAPNIASWNMQSMAGAVFHELIHDTDANMTNVLITPDWRIWLIDFSRAFRTAKYLRYPKTLVMCDRKLLANMRALSDSVLKQKLGRWLEKPEIEGLLARRDIIVKFFDKEVAAKGEAAVLYDLPQTSELCGAGLQ